MTFICLAVADAHCHSPCLPAKCARLPKEPRSPCSHGWRKLTCTQMACPLLSSGQGGVAPIRSNSVAHDGVRPVGLPLASGPHHHGVCAFACMPLLQFETAPQLTQLALYRFMGSGVGFLASSSLPAVAAAGHTSALNRQLGLAHPASCACSTSAAGASRGVAQRNAITPIRNDAPHV